MDKQIIGWIRSRWCSNNRKDGQMMKVKLRRRIDLASITSMTHSPQTHSKIWIRWSHNPIHTVTQEEWVPVCHHSQRSKATKTKWIYRNPPHQPKRRIWKQWRILNRGRHQILGPSDTEMPTLGFSSCLLIHFWTKDNEMIMNRWFKRNSCNVIKNLTTC